MKTRIKYLVLPLGLMMSAASFAGVNEIGGGFATGLSKIFGGAIDITSHTYVTAVHPGMKYLGDSIDKTTNYFK